MLSTLKELLLMLKEKKKIWLVPLVFFLIFLGLLAILGQGSILAPFIYTIF
tara:strand:- start:1327 stop:1479 length:153 start_codon:yes stop_codon:yes gene_type:complete